jgi:hypothetical protein
MEIVDYSKEFKIQESHCGKHSIMFPKNIFCVIAGPTGCGKTNLMVNLLRKPDTLSYSDIYVYCSTLYQKSYDNLKKYYENLEKMIKSQNKISIKIAHFLDADEKIKNPSELDKTQNHIMIFDDVMLEDQTQIKDYFCRGRHNNVNVFYLCQSLNKIAKHCIKDNANIFILFKQNDKTLKHFHESHISGDMDLKEFQSFCYKAWNKKHGFVVINIWDDDYFGRYWSNYKSVYIPDKYKIKK